MRKTLDSFQFEFSAKMSQFGVFLKKARSLGALVKIEHTLFGLPLALTGAVLAAQGLPEFRTVALACGAFGGARVAAMAFNRLVDRRFDADNPRTATREIPSGIIEVEWAWGVVITACAAFFLCAGALNDVCFYFSPLVLALLLSYSYTKRFTVWCHVVLGLCLGLAPLAGWLAVTPEWSSIPVVLGLGVVFWVAGYDIIYACQDADFDRRTGLYSLPARLGVSNALRAAAFFHVIAFGLFILAGILASLTWPFYAMSVITAALLCREHRIVRPNDLSRLDLAFFNVNSMISVSLFASVCVGLP
jgi:4-hydroxybenzoate polyprenyltransferase